MKKLENWSAVNSLGLFEPMDSICPMRLHGLNPDIGYNVYTSRVISWNGKTVETISGSTYRLGKMSEEYGKWLANKENSWNDAWSR